LGDGAALVLLRADAATAARTVPHLGEWLLRTGCDRVLERLAAGALWLAAAWLAAGLLAASAAALPGTPGRLAAALSRALLPRAARRLVAGAAGLGVLLSPAAALASAAHPANPAKSASPLGGAAASAAATPHHSPGPLPPPSWPTSSAPRSHSKAPTVARRRHSPVLVPTQPIPRRPTGPTPPRSETGRSVGSEMVRVRPGDCLWMLAARHLPASATDTDIAAYWPRWYAANRAVIGAEPDLLHPGELLHVPQPPHAASS
jgi:hypothetical protein